MVQTFHSIHEIDPEFISNLETLMEEEIPGVSFLQETEDSAPESDTFSYFLFFGPTQNAPIGFSRLNLRKLPWKNYVPWWRRLMFWNKDYLHWKQASWQISNSLEGPCVFDQKFKRSGKEKMISLFKETMNREDFIIGEVTCLQDVNEFEIPWTETFKNQKQLWVLGHYERNCKSYQDYLENLGPDVAIEIKQNWKKLHKNLHIKLGDYPHFEDASLDKMDPLFKEKYKKLNAHVLTFEKDNEVLGCLFLMKGKNGNFFFEPFVFESAPEPIISEELYTQYAILKFFEFPEARKCHLLRENSKLLFENKDDCIQFELQGFKIFELKQTFSSKLKKIQLPI